MSEFKKYANCIVSQVTLTLTFVEDMLDVNQLIEGAFSLNLERFNPNKVLKMIEVIFQPQARAKGIELTATVENFLMPPDFASELLLPDIQNGLNKMKLPNLIGDERRLKQVLYNLVKNALKYTE